MAHGNRPGHLLSARNRTSFPGWTFPVRVYYLKIDSSLWHAASSTTESAEWSEWSAISLHIAKRKYTNAWHTATDLGIYRAPWIGPRSCAHRKREIYERMAHGNRPGHLLSARNRTSFPGWTYPVRAYYLKIDSSLWHAASSTMYAGRADVTSIATPLLNLLIFFWWFNSIVLIITCQLFELAHSDTFFFNDLTLWISETGSHEWSEPITAEHTSKNRA